MQDYLLDILILGLLVLLFVATSRQRTSRRLRLWTWGWALILIHFAVLVIPAGSDFAQSLTAAVALGSLFLSGVAFVLASTIVCFPGRSWLVAAAFLGLPTLTFLAARFLAPQNFTIAYVLIVVIETAAVLLAAPFRAEHPRTFLAVSSSGMVCAAWAAGNIGRGHADDAIYAILTQVFFLAACLFWKEYRRLTAGVITCSLGMLAWSAVFPAALFIEAWMPHVVVAPGLWNVPKYFVAFGMILTLLEDELTNAGKASENYRLLFAANPHPMWIYATDTCAFLHVNDAAIAHYGYSRDEFLAMTLADISTAEDVFNFQIASPRARSMKLSGPWRHRKKDSSWIDVDLASQSIVFAGRPARFVMVQDVTERERLHRQLLYQAHHDTLTGLPNRLLLQDRMEQALRNAQRHGHKAALLCMDLDRFKQINDTFGHSVGDLALKYVADNLRMRLRAIDTIARTGGEEFTVILGDLANNGDAEKVALDLLHGLQRPVELDGYQVELAASIGIAIYPDDGTDTATLWRSADAAMYRAKRSGGNRYVLVSHEISRSASEANELEQYMRRMLHEGCFEVHYQPQFAADGRLRSVEALLRLHHPTLGEISPERFIPIAEESGLIVRIGNWVIEEVCRQIAQWNAEGLRPLAIALNVSPSQFMQLDFAEYVKSLVSRYRVDPALIELELTETAVMQNLHDVAQQMSTLAKIGIQFAVDDFGTGYSSLGHLFQLPINTLKIDRSFVERITDENGTYSIVQAIISLAHNLGMQVIGEGVERGDQAATLRKLRCDFLQGYLFSRALPADAVPALIRENQMLTRL